MTYVATYIDVQPDSASQGDSSVPKFGVHNRQIKLGPDLINALNSQFLTLIRGEPAQHSSPVESHLGLTSGPLG